MCCTAIDPIDPVYMENDSEQRASKAYGGYCPGGPVPESLPEDARIKWEGWDYIQKEWTSTGVVAS